jgi:hypothetical protein
MGATIGIAAATPIARQSLVPRSLPAINPITIGNIAVYSRRVK